MNDFKMRIGRAQMNDPANRTRLHRSVPPVHDITTLEAHQLRSIPTPTTMTKLPSVSERKYHRKLLAKVVGLDPCLLESAKISSNPPSPISRRNFTHLATNRKTIMTQTDVVADPVCDVITGTGLSRTPRLMRDGPNSKYGVRRQISDFNELELGPEIEDNLSKDATSHHVTVDLIVSPREVQVQNKTALVPAQQSSTEKRRNAPWVYCYKIKKDRQRITKILVKEQNVTADQLLPTVL